MIVDRLVIFQGAVSRIAAIRLGEDAITDLRHAIAVEEDWFVYGTLHINLRACVLVDIQDA